MKLRGLEENQVYQFELEGIQYEKTGAFLMNRGVQVKLYGDYDSKLLRFKKKG